MQTDNNQTCITQSTPTSRGERPRAAGASGRHTCRTLGRCPCNGPGDQTPQRHRQTLQDSVSCCRRLLTWRSRGPPQAGAWTPARAPSSSPASGVPVTAPVLAGPQDPATFPPVRLAPGYLGDGQPPTRPDAAVFERRMSLPNIGVAISSSRLLKFAGISLLEARGK